VSCLNYVLATWLNTEQEEEEEDDDDDDDDGQK